MIINFNYKIYKLFFLIFHVFILVEMNESNGWNYFFLCLLYI